MKEVLTNIIEAIQQRRREFESGWQQRADGYSHMRGDDSGDEPNHTPAGSQEWDRWLERRGYK